MANDEKVKEALQWYDKNKKLYEKFNFTQNFKF